MKRIIFSLSLLLIISYTANAQFLNWGVKGGVSSSSIKFDKTTFTNPENAEEFIVEQGDSKLGIHLGVFGRIQAFSIFIQPELLFSQTKGELVINNVNNENIEPFIASQTFNKFDIPVMVGKKFGPAKVFLGPVATFMISEKSDLKEFFGVDAETEFNKAVFGYQAGVGIDIGSFATVDLKYEGNLSKLGDSMVIAGETRNFDQRNPQWIVSIGIFF